MGLELYRTLWLRGTGLWLDVRVWRIRGVWGVSPVVEKHIVEASTQHEKNTVACAKTLLGRPPLTPVSEGIARANFSTCFSLTILRMVKHKRTWKLTRQGRLDQTRMSRSSNRVHEALRGLTS